MNTFKNITAIILLLTLIACVTINVYFPAAAAERAGAAAINKG